RRAGRRRESQGGRVLGDRGSLSLARVSQLAWSTLLRDRLQQRSDARHIVANVSVEALELDFSRLDTLNTNFRLQLGVSAGVCDRCAERVQHPLRRLSRRENAIPSGVVVIDAL